MSGRENGLMTPRQPPERREGAKSARFLEDEIRAYHALANALLEISGGAFLFRIGLGWRARNYRTI